MASQGVVAIPDLRQYEVQIRPTGRELGRGAYGSVEEVEIPGVLCAAKRIHEGLLNVANAEEVRRVTEAFVSECRLMSALRHPHIVQFMGVCHLSGSRLPSLVMERLNSCLHEELENTPNIRLTTKLSILIDVARGLVYLHSHNPPVIHRDLTARNVLLNSAFVAKIADLGVARILDLRGDRLVQTMTKGPGNIVYMPPEAIDDHARYNESIDIFSFGNLTLFTLTQVFPQVKAATFTDPRSGRVTARTEIERRSDGIQLLERMLGHQSQYLLLTQHCLQNLPTHRPNSGGLLEMLENLRSNLPNPAGSALLSEQELRRSLLNSQEQVQQLRDTIVNIQARNEEFQQELQRITQHFQQQIRQQNEMTSRSLQQQTEALQRQTEALQRQQQQIELLQQQNTSLSQQIESLQRKSASHQQENGKQFEEIRRSQRTQNQQIQAFGERLNVQQQIALQVGSQSEAVAMVGQSVSVECMLGVYYRDRLIQLQLPGSTTIREVSNLSIQQPISCVHSPHNYVSFVCL